MNFNIFYELLKTGPEVAFSSMLVLLNTATFKESGRERARVSPAAPLPIIRTLIMVNA